jgi:hypothetical protein
MVSILDLRVLKTFEPFRCFLAIRKMVEKHTGKAIISEYEDVLEEWGIPISKVKIFNIKLYNVSIYFFLVH